MNKTLSALTLMALGSWTDSLAVAQAVEAPVKFKAPTRMMAGEKFFGQERAYPSPALHDINGDGHVDLLVADLMGRVTVALGTGSKPMSFGAEKTLLGSDKKPLNFNNW